MSGDSCTSSTIDLVLEAKTIDHNNSLEEEQTLTTQDDSKAMMNEVSNSKESNNNSAIVQTNTSGTQLNDKLVHKALIIEGEKPIGPSIENQTSSNSSSSSSIVELGDDPNFINNIMNSNNQPQHTTEHHSHDETSTKHQSLNNQSSSLDSGSVMTSTTTTPRKTLLITSSIPTPPSEISILNQVDNADSQHNGPPPDNYDLGITSTGRKIRDSLIICSEPTTSSTTLPFSTLSSVTMQQLSLNSSNNKRNSTSSSSSSTMGANTSGAITGRRKEKPIPSIVTSTQQVLVNVTPSNNNPKNELITLLHRLISEHQLEKLEKILKDEVKKHDESTIHEKSEDVNTPTLANGVTPENKSVSEHSRTSSEASTNSANSSNQTGDLMNGNLTNTTNVEPYGNTQDCLTEKKHETPRGKFDIDSDFISEQTGRTLLMTAVAHENIKIIRLLHKEFNSNLEFRDKRGRTAIFYACNVSQHRTSSILQYLISEGANVNLKDNEDFAPFYLCMESQNFQAASVLFSEGKADVNTQVGPEKNTTVHIAIKKDLITSVHFLVKRCMCDLTIPNARGETPIFLALQHPAILNQILMDLTEKKVNTEIFDANNYKLKAIEIEDVNGNNCLHICAEFGYIDSIGEILSVLPEEIVRKLSSTHNKDGNTPLHVAVSHNHPELTFVLLFVNPDCAFFQNSDWDTPLHVALKQGNFKSARILYPLSKYLDLENSEGQSIQYLVQLFGQELRQQDDTLKNLTEGEFFKPTSYYFENLLQDFSFISRMKDYLATSNQQDAISFFETVMEYQLAPTTSQRYEMAEKVVNQYISENATVKLKFIKPKREEFINKWKEYSKIFCPPYLFEEYLDLALEEMRSNLFPKFVASKVFKKWVENKRKSDPTFYLRFLRKEAAPLEQDKTESTPLNLFEETLQEEQENDLKNRKLCGKCGDALLDLNDYLFVKSDFDRAIEQSMEFVGWSQLESDQTLGKVYISPKGAHIHLDTKKKYTAVKFTGHLEHSNHTTFNMWLDPDYLYMRDPSILTSKQIDMVSNRNFSSTIQHDIYSMAWPNSNREFLTATCCTFRANTNTYICLQKSVTHPKCLENSKQVRAKIKSLFIVERINDTRCKYTYQVVSDFGGFLGSDFYSNMIKDRGNYFHLLLSRTVKARETVGKGKPSHGGLVESLDYAIAHSQNNEQ